MALVDERLAGLVDAVAAAQRHHIAICLANTLKSINTVEGPALQERADSKAAGMACTAADAALEDYRAGMLFDAMMNNVRKR